MEIGPYMLKWKVPDEGAEGEIMLESIQYRFDLPTVTIVTVAEPYRYKFMEELIAGRLRHKSITSYI